VLSNIGGILLVSISLLGVLLTANFRKKEENITAYWIFIFASLAWFLVSLTVTQSSNNILMIIGAISIPFAALILYSLAKKEEIDTKYMFILGVWYLGTLFATTKGIRFIMVVIPIYAIGLGIVFGKVQKGLTNLLMGEQKITKEETKNMIAFLISGSIGIGIALLLIFLPMGGISMWKGADAVAKNELPTPVSDTWAALLNDINSKSEPNAIITSWWDYGHVFKALADRPVTFDGGSQNTPQAHWVGKLLWTDDERKSIGILRMLDCGANGAFDIINEKIGNVHESVDIINEIIAVDKDSAEKILLSVDKIDEKTTDNILEKTHCQPPQGFIIASEDMVNQEYGLILEAGVLKRQRYMQIKID